MAAVMPEIEWYKKHGCDHAHCPQGCDKPQPALKDGVMYCMRCLVGYGRLSEMVPCTPATCPEDA